MQLKIEKTARFITIIFVPLSGLGQEQVTEINKRSRELGAKEDTAIFYDKTKVGDHHLEDILKGKYKWVYMSPEKALHQDVMNCVCMGKCGLQIKNPAICCRRGSSCFRMVNEYAE